MYAQRPGHFLTGEAIDLTIAGERLDHVRHSHDGTGLHHLHLDGRILIQGSEATCTVRWVRGRTARIGTGRPVALVPGSRVVVYMELLGRVEGIGSQVGSSEFDVEIAAPAAKWGRLQRQFAIVAAMAPGDRENLRGHRRIALDAPDVQVSLTDGWTTGARIRDVSRSGAAVTSGAVPEVGSLVTLGSTRGRVVRLLEEGFAVQFLRLLPLERFGPAYAL